MENPFINYTPIKYAPQLPTFDISEALKDSKFKTFLEEYGVDPKEIKDQTTLDNWLAQYSASINQNSKKSEVEGSKIPKQKTPEQLRLARIRALATGKGLKSIADSFNDYEVLVNQLSEDGKLSKGDFKQLAGSLGLNKDQTKAFRKAYKRGEDTSAFMGNLKRKSYVKDGKIFTEGEEDFSPNDYDTISADPNGFFYEGNDINELVDKYNNKVLDWRNKKDNISYDAATGEYWAEGFNGGNRVNVTNSDWAQAQRDTARNSWFEANKNNISYDPNTQGYLFKGKAMKDSSWLDLNYTKKLQAKAYVNEVNSLATNADQMNAWASTYNKGNMNKVLGITDEEAKADNYSETYHNALTKHLKDIAMDPTKGSIQSDALLQYLISQGLNSIGNKNAVTYIPESRMVRAQLALNPKTDRYSFKNGGSFTKARAYKNGGNLKKYQEGGDLAYTAMDVGKSAVTRVGFRAPAAINHWVNPVLELETTLPTEPNVQPGSVYSGYLASAYTQPTNLDYSLNSNEFYRKNGGTLNMEKINYFLEGGAMAPKAAPAAAPAKGGQDIQAQVMQLVQAAMSGDELANLAILQIMLAAQQGDQQAAQIAQMIQEVAKLMQGQATAAKNGAKLAYIKSLKSGCPAGTEAKYYKKGGTLCKECVSKSRNTEMYQDKGLFKATDSITNAVKGAYNNVINKVNNTIFGEQQAQAESTGIDSTGLYKKGGCLKKKLCGKKKALEGAKVTEEKCGGTVKEKCGGKVAEEKCGGKAKKAKCELGAELNKCGGKTKKKSKCEMGAELEKCGGKAKKKYFGGAVESDKCGGKTKKAACGSKAPKAACGTKANMDKCGGKAKKKCLTGGILTLEALQAAYKSLNA